MTEINKGFGVLLINLGGPESLDQVRPYLYELFSDPDIIQIPLGFILQKPLARIISGRRAKEAERRYALIGGKSPLIEETRKQAAGLEKILGAPVGFAMRYLEPRISAALENLKSRGLEKLIVIPLFPQYSIATTGSAVAAFKAQNRFFKFVLVNYHFDHEGFLAALASRFAEAAGEMKTGLRSQILFVAHSLPEKYLAAGDPYVTQVEKTAALLYERLKTDLPHSLAYQSRLGPVRWHGPSLENELGKVIATGVQQLLVQPVSFVSENLETLYDLDIEFKEKCLAAGIQNYVRVKCPGDSELYLNALAALAQRASLENKWEKQGG